MLYGKAIVGRIVLLSFLFVVVPYVVIAVENKLTAEKIDWCDENYQFYQLLGVHKFLQIQRWSLKARVCTHLYKDPLWIDEGIDRRARLVDRSGIYMEQEIENSRKQAERGLSNLGILASPGTEP